MKLYFSPGACSLAAHISLHESGMAFEHEKVDLRAKLTASGEDFTAINPKGYVPALVIDSGEEITENVAILDWIVEQNPALGPGGAMGRTRLLEMLAYISTEIHKSFKPFFAGASDEEKAKAGEMIGKRMALLAKGLEEQDFLFASGFTVADSYLFVMLLWAEKMQVAVPDPLTEYRERLKQRPSVVKALTHEGLIPAPEPA